MTMPSALAETLAMISRAARMAEDDWWIIGSTAVALHGGNVPVIKDVDLMMSSRDARRLISDAQGTFVTPTPSERFRSEVFGVWTAPPVPVEIFGGFQIAHIDGWRDVSFAIRHPIPVPGGEIWVPVVDELRDLLRAFGRAKDFERLRLLEP